MGTKEAIVAKYLKLMMEEGLGFDLSDPNLTHTPQRMAKMYVTEFFAGVDTEFEGFSVFPNEEEYDQLIIAERLRFVSICAHHFLPFLGLAWFGYIPDKRLVGLSKIARVVSHYAARPQLQENLTHEILNRFVEEVRPKGAMLILKATHGCQSCRGVRQTETHMATSAVYGALEEDEKVRTEMLSILKLDIHTGG